MRLTRAEMFEGAREERAPGVAGIAAGAAEQQPRAPGIFLRFYARVRAGPSFARVSTDSTVYTRTVVHTAGINIV